MPRAERVLRQVVRADLVRRWHLEKDLEEVVGLLTWTARRDKSLQFKGLLCKGTGQSMLGAL